MAERGQASYPRRVDRLLGRWVPARRGWGGNLPRGLVNAVVASSLCPKPLRWLVLRAYGLQVHTRGIMERCFFGGSDIAIGACSTVNVGCVFDNSGPIEIGEGCQLGMGVLITTSYHEDEGPTRRAGRSRSKAVRIGDGCWIGSRAVILPGVTIGAGCVVGAGSIVTRDCAANGVYVGSPARRMRDLSGGDARDVANAALETLATAD